MHEQQKVENQKTSAPTKNGGGAENEFASPACYAHEMDPAYMWAAPQRRPSLLWRIIALLKRSRAA